MNWFEELDRLTAPPSVASKVRLFSRAEIELLEATGAITPVERIPVYRRTGRMVVPAAWDRGFYARYGH